MDSQPFALIAVIAAVVLAIGIAVVASRYRRQQRSAALRKQFGSEYDRALAEHGEREKAESELLLRQRRLEQLPIQLLSVEQCDRFGAAWEGVQKRFVDDPSGAVREADALVKQVMSARGYPMGDFEQRVADLSVEHGKVIEHYRAARDIALANANSQAGTEDLRQAMVHYRALFSDLLQARTPHAPLREAHA